MFGLLPKNFEFYDCFDRAVNNAVRLPELLLESAKTANGRRQRTRCRRSWKSSTRAIASPTRRSIASNRLTLRRLTAKTFTA